MKRSSVAPRGRDRQADLRTSDAAVNLGELVCGASEADAEAFDLTEPAFAFGFRDAGDEVVVDLLQPRTLGGVWPEERTTNTSVLMDARS
jgi:hypothetical protein